MKLEFDAIEIQNFRSFVGEPALLSLGESGPGLHFIRGDNQADPDLHPNGAGKSSIWHAFIWCIEGSTQDGLRNPDIRPWFGDDGPTKVTIFLHTDSTAHTITRTANPNLLTLNGKECSQADIYKLLRMTTDTISHTAILGQGRPLFFDLKPKEKMDLFGSVLDLDRWELWSGAAAATCKEFDAKESALGIELAAFNNQSGEITRAVTALKLQSEAWENERAKHVDTSAAKLKELEKQRAPILNQRDKADLEFDSAGTELKALYDDINKQTLAHGKLAQDINAKRAKIELLEDELDKITTLKKSRACPTCNQSVSPLHLKAHGNDLRKQIAVITNSIDATKLGQSEKILSRSHFAQKQFKEKADDANDRLLKYNSAIAVIDAQIKEIKSTKRTRQEETNPFGDQIRKMQKRQKAIHADIEDVNKEIDQIKRQTTRTKFWVKGFKDVRLYMIEEILQELNLITNAMLESFGLIDWQIVYDIEKETKTGNVQHGLNVSVLSPYNDKPVRWEVWSGGEKQRLRLAGALALGQVLLNHAGITCNLEVLDEPTRGLSRNGVRDLCDHLADRAVDLDKTIFFIDHMAHESSQFASVTTVVRDTQGSFLK